MTHAQQVRKTRKTIVQADHIGELDGTGGGVVVTKPVAKKKPATKKKPAATKKAATKRKAAVKKTAGK